MISVNHRKLLESLFAPCSAEEFLSKYWPNKPFSTHGDPARLPEYLRSELLLSFDNLSANYHGRVAFGNAATTDKTVKAENVPTGLLRKMGLSLYLLDLPSNVPGTDKFLREVEQAFGAKEGIARIGAFAAPVHNGVTSHFDSEEVISIQLEGVKRFYIAPMHEIPYPYGMQFGPGYRAYDDLYPQMSGGIPKVDNAEFQCVEMRPGSVLFMPRGTWHRTEATQESLSVSIILRQPAPFEEILEQLRHTLLRDPEWRRPLYILDRGDENLRKQIDTLLQDLPNACKTLSVDDILDNSLPELERMANLKETTWFQRVPQTRLQLNPDPLHSDFWTGSVRGNRQGSEYEIVPLQIPVNLLPLFQWLEKEERPILAGELSNRFPAIAFDDIKAILEGLTRATYLKPLRHVPPPLTK